jgi:hypothetical protein
MHEDVPTYSDCAEVTQARNASRSSPTLDTGKHMNSDSRLSSPFIIGATVSIKDALDIKWVMINVWSGNVD